MPTAIFDPLASVIVHSQVPVNPLTFQLLEGEEALLVHGCRRQASRQEWRRFNRHGKLIVFVRHSPVLTYSVRATALDPTGENLGNFHPGRCLSDRALAFINGSRTPFQFEREVEGVIPGKLILLNPSQEPGAGDATEVDFTIEHAFVDVDVARFPGGSIATPAEPELFVTLAAQGASRLTAAALNAILRGAFLNEHLLGTGPLTLTLYDGDPAAGGVAVSDALPLPVTGWDWGEPDEPQTTLLRNAAALEFLDASGADRSVTHLLYARGGVIVAAPALGSPIVIPGYYGLRIPPLALGLLLTWEKDGAQTPGHPARGAFSYLFGSDDMAPAETALWVTAFDGDPYTSGVLVGDTDLSIPRDSGGWTVSGAVASSAAAVSGAIVAPAGGWEIPFAAAGVNGFNWRLCVNALAPLVVPEGGTITLPVGTFTVSIS